jgi:hypothetical protein
VVMACRRADFDREEEERARRGAWAAAQAREGASSSCGERAVRSRSSEETRTDQNIFPPFFRH